MHSRLEYENSHRDPYLIGAMLVVSAIFGLCFYVCAIILVWKILGWLAE